jgi:16S rRNA (guanine(1405)-N(7))-methyltransferase
MENIQQDTILKDILQSKKYKHIYPPTIERIITDLSTKYPPKQLEKEVKKKLHQLWGAYFNRPNFKKLENRIREEYTNGRDKKEILDELLLLQTSTQERLPIYDQFYKEIFKYIDKYDTVIDYGCGINPLSYLYMDTNIQYTGYDVDSELMNFMNTIFQILEIPNATTQLGDILLFDKYPHSDVSFLFKVLALIERQQKESSLEILKKINSRYIVVSFPTKTLTGIDKGMKDNYKEMFYNLIEKETWQTSETAFSNELVFIVDKS